MILSENLKNAYTFQFLVEEVFKAVEVEALKNWRSSEIRLRLKLPYALLSLVTRDSQNNR